MRAPLRDLKPMQLLWFIGVSNLTATLAVAVLAVKSWHLSEDQHLPPNVRSFGIATIFISLAAAFVAEWAIQRGLRSNAWTEDALARPRRYLSHPALTILIVVMVVFLSLIFSVSPHINGALYSLFLSLPLSLIRMSTVLKNPEETRTGFPSGSALYPAKPLQSDQWGS
jgi:hypothetical protein